MKSGRVNMWIKLFFINYVAGLFGLIVLALLDGRSSGESWAGLVGLVSILSVPVLLAPSAISASVAFLLAPRMNASIVAAVDGAIQSLSVNLMLGLWNESLTQGTLPLFPALLLAIAAAVLTYVCIGR